MITNLRVEKAGRELELLLSSLFDLRVWSIGPETRHHWSLDLAGISIALPSKFLQEGYAWEGESSSSTISAPPTVCLHSRRLIPTNITQCAAFSVNWKLDIPSDIAQQVDRFLCFIDGSQREIPAAASYWFHANTVLSHSKSASFVALVSAIEACLGLHRRPKLPSVKNFSNRARGPAHPLGGQAELRGPRARIH